MSVDGELWRAGGVDSARCLLVGLLLIGAPALGATPDSQRATTDGEALEVLRAVEPERVRRLSPQPPAAGERRVVRVPSGVIVELVDPVFDTTDAHFEAEGDDLVVYLADGGVLVLEGLLGHDEHQTLLRVPGDPAASVAELRTRGILFTVPMEAAGPPAGAGAEIFSAVPVLRWFLGRLDSSGAAQAAEPDEPLLAIGSPALQQVADQLRIAWAEARFERVNAHRELLQSVAEKVRALEANGAATGQDVQAVQVAVLQSRLAIEDASLELTLAIDHHQDAHGSRLARAQFPKWQTEPPLSLDAIRQSLAAEQRAEARRHLRRLHHARASLDLIEELLPLAERLREAQRQQFELGTIGIAQLVVSEDVLLHAALAEVDRQYDRSRAEAWLLAAAGALDDRYIAQPGWD